MASLQQVAGQYHICFRFNGRRYKRSLKTERFDKADARRVRLEETIRLVETGRLDIPEDTVDIASFLMTAGKVKANGRGQIMPPIVAELGRRP